MLFVVNRQYDITFVRPATVCTYTECRKCTAKRAFTFHYVFCILEDKVRTLFGLIRPELNAAHIQDFLKHLCTTRVVVVINVDNNIVVRYNPTDAATVCDPVLSFAYVQRVLKTATVYRLFTFFSSCFIVQFFFVERGQLDELSTWKQFAETVKVHSLHLLVLYTH